MTDAALAAPSPPVWRRLIGFNLLTAIVLGVAGWYVGWFGAHAIVGAEPRLLRRHRLQRALRLPRATSAASSASSSGSASSTIPFARMLGYPPSLREKEEGGWTRYFSLCTDHKVVGIQYLWGIGLFFFIGGLNAMLIRTELLTPHNQVFPAGTYLTHRRDARHDDDGDDDERDSRPVRELLRPDHDRRPADGLPADRGAHVLAADGGRGDPDHDRSSSAASRRAGRATRRSRPRPTRESTTTSSSSPWSASR